MSRPSLVPRRHDPFWDLDGSGARRARTQRRLVRYLTWLIAIVVLAVVLTRLPAVDPEYLIHGDGRPIFAGVLLTLLAAFVLIGLAKIRRGSGQH